MQHLTLMQQKERTSWRPHDVRAHVKAHWLADDAMSHPHLRASSVRRKAPTLFDLEENSFHALTFCLSLQFTTNVRAVSLTKLFLAKISETTF